VRARAPLFSGDGVHPRSRGVEGRGCVCAGSTVEDVCWGNNRGVRHGALGLIVAGSDGLAAASDSVHVTRCT
jgi:hypothetical protein